jgi:hypothetical protein
MTVNPDFDYVLNSFGPDYADSFERDLGTQANCMHSWVSGMMYVADEDLDLISESMKVECEKCEKVYNANEGSDEKFPYIIETDDRGFDMVTRIDNL